MTMDIDQLLAQAAATERASHLDPGFVARMEQRLEATPELSVLGFLPVFAAALAALLVAPELMGDPLDWSGLLGGLSEPPGLQIVAEAFTGMSGNVSVLWPYGVGLFVVLVPFWVPASDL